MTPKEIADRLRRMVPEYDATNINIDAHYKFRKGEYVRTEDVIALADELDPPKPEPGTVVWWQRKAKETAWGIGIVDSESYGVMHMTGLTSLGDIEYKPARILAPDEVAVKVPPVSEWPEWADHIVAVWRCSATGENGIARDIITRYQAERMEATE